MAGKAGGQKSHDLIKLVAPAATADVYLTGARVTEELSKISEVTVEFFCESTALDIQALLGSRMAVEIGMGDFDGSSFASTRKVIGTCVSIESLGLTQGFPAYSVELRPWPWFLTKGGGNAIFAEMTAPDIIKKVCRDAGFSDFTDRLSGTYRKRIYTCQYNETNFDFICRLMEDEGIYYYFDYSGSVEKLVFADSQSSHDPVPVKSAFKYDPRNAGASYDEDELYDWAEKRKVTSGKIKLVNYDFTKPNADLKTLAAVPKGNHGHKNYEHYQQDAQYTEVADGEAYARSRAEGQAHDAEGYFGSGNARTLHVGSTVGLEGHPAISDKDSLILATTYFFRTEATTVIEHAADVISNVSRIVFPDMKGPVHVDFKAAPKTEQFRPPMTTETPKLLGVYVGIVEGGDGDEIFTDEYGRIKVRFPWILDSSDATTYWVRVVTPWAGTGYGMYGIPRVGQEVVIQFVNGHPDHPICTGCVYNAVNTHPWPLPGQMTKSGIKTKSSKGGAEDAFHELTFDDLNGKEMVRFQSEKDYNQVIKNNAVITIGLEKADAGDLTQTIENHKTETLNKGNYTQTVKTGSRILKVKTDHTDTIQGKSTTTITGDTARTIKTGNVTEKVNKGNVTTTVKTGNVSSTVTKGNSELKVKTGNHKMTIAKGHSTATVSAGNNSLIVSKGNNITNVKAGNDTTTLNSGNVTIKAKGGNVTINAAKAITLKVGGSSVKITPSSIIIKSAMVKLDGKKTTVAGSAMTEVKGAITKVEASGILTLKGSLTKIN